MNNIAEKLQAILGAKGDIKDAIEAKGVTVGDATLAEYAGKIGEISGGGSGLSYVSGTLTLSSTQTSISIPYASVSGKVTVYLAHRSPTYGVNGVIGFWGTNYFFDNFEISNSNHKLFGVLETRTTFSTYATPLFGYNFTFDVNPTDIVIGVRNGSYPYQAGTYDYLIIENQ